MKNLLLALCVGSLWLVSCERRGAPVPKICTNAKVGVGNLVSMKLGDTLTLVSCSEHTTRQRWVMPDGGSSTNNTVYYVAATLDTVTVHLYVGNDDFVQEYETTERIAILP